ncbi:MAG: outer membrane lipoprotein-sorting protein [Deltaproteobacteria bacterium]|nr:outer membrane lipoprotein-sorting protein [Deltaproteobacteria bacterium]MCB9785662.1 outer membrane lipoprotein-sorting protein [Deltaproteobacteria bacterium]
MTFASLLSCVLLPAVAFAETPAEKGRRISAEAEKAGDGFKSESSLMTMILINAQGDRVERKMRSRTMEVDGDGDRAIITFEWPADVKGTKLLTWSHKKDEDDQWLFLPSLKRVKRISSRNRSGSFMGSEFAYEDLGSQELDKYTDYKWLRQETVDGRPVEVIERVPTDRRSGYSRQIVWMDTGYQWPVKIEFYDRKNELLKTMTFSGWKQFGRYWRAGGIKVENHQTKKSSELSWEDRKLGVDVSASEFESANLDE